MNTILDTTGSYKSQAERIRSDSFYAARASDKSIPTLRSLQAIERNHDRATALSHLSSKAFVRIAEEHRERKDGHAPDRFVCGKSKLGRRANAWKWTSLYSWCAENDRPLAFYSFPFDSPAIGLPDLVPSRFIYDPNAIERIKPRLAELFGDDPRIIKLEVGKDEKHHLHGVAPLQSNPILHPLDDPEAAKLVYGYSGVVRYVSKAFSKPYLRLEGEFLVAQMLAGPKQLPRITWQTNLPEAPKNFH